MGGSCGEQGVFAKDAITLGAGEKTVGGVAGACWGRSNSPGSESRAWRSSGGPRDGKTGNY